MKRVVLDSFALLAYCEAESGAPAVSRILQRALKGEVEVFLCIVNWGEMLYIALRECGEKVAEQYCSTIAKYPIEIISPDEPLTRKAAYYKAHHKLSYADAFAAALATLKKATLVTGDPEFKALEKDVEILWINKK